MPLRQHPYAANEVQIVLRTGVPPESPAEADPALRAARVQPMVALREP